MSNKKITELPDNSIPDPNSIIEITAGPHKTMMRINIGENTSKTREEAIALIDHVFESGCLPFIISVRK